MKRKATRRKRHSITITIDYDVVRVLKNKGSDVFTHKLPEGDANRFKLLNSVDTPLTHIYFRKPGLSYYGQSYKINKTIRRSNNTYVKIERV